jgi:hypothetical protein
VGFEPTIPASERAKTVHALDCSATVAGCVHGYQSELRFVTLECYVIHSSTWPKYIAFKDDVTQKWLKLLVEGGIIYMEHKYRLLFLVNNYLEKSDDEI